MQFFEGHKAPPESGATAWFTDDATWMTLQQIHREHTRSPDDVQPVDVRAGSERCVQLRGDPARRDQVHRSGVIRSAQRSKRALHGVDRLAGQDRDQIRLM